MFLIPQHYYSIRKTEQKGRGVFAETDIMPGTVIGDYLGVIMPTENAFKTEPMGTYYMELTKTHAALADKNSDGIHVINHSCEPNCGSDNFQDRVLYIALRKIFKGEELTVNYNFGPPNPAICNPCRHACHCGSRFCTGSMHTAGDKDSLIEDDYSSNSKAFNDSVARHEGKMLQPMSRYPKQMGDDTFFDLFGYEKIGPMILEDLRLPSIKKLRETIRSSGRTLAFPKIGLLVHGVKGDSLVSSVLKK